ncbi:hypothetical protein, partial [Pseudomonas putida]|uniref:hypothetical protein n=1 Tax=Pseudomonas putida TaxID=303 RepID=UPI00197FF2F0
IISMLITLCSPAQKMSRCSGTPGSVFSQHNGRNWVIFRSAATLTHLGRLLPAAIDSYGSLAVAWRCPLLADFCTW